MVCACGGNCQCQGGDQGDFDKGSLGEASAKALFMILTERAQQSIQWGDEHDNGHTEDDWIQLILHYAMEKKDFVAVGALAVAAIESQLRTGAWGA